MEAANRGASDVGAPSIGFNITLPHEQVPNPHSTPELTFRFHYFAMRKMHLAMRANALAVFPGGFGTLDELFEILTLQQTGKAPPMPVVLFGREYWNRAHQFSSDGGGRRRLRARSRPVRNRRYGGGGLARRYAARAYRPWPGGAGGLECFRKSAKRFSDEKHDKPTKCFTEKCEAVFR